MTFVDKFEKYFKEQKDEETSSQNSDRPKLPEMANHTGQQATNVSCVESERALSIAEVSFIGKSVLF